MSSPTVTPLHQPVVLPLRHYVLVGIGHWGRAALDAAARSLSFAHPELVEASQWLCLAPEGWSSLDTIALPLSSATSPAAEKDWLEKGRGEAMATLKTALESATSQRQVQSLSRRHYQPVSGKQSILDVCLVGRMDDPFTQSVLLDVVGLVREVRPSSTKLTLNLFLGVDSPGFPLLSDGDEQSLLLFVESLDRALTQELDNPESHEEGIGWCYVADTVDDSGHALARTSPSSEGQDDLPILLSEVTGAFIAMLAGSEMREHASYTCLALPEMVERAKMKADRGYCSAFSCAAWTIPAHDLYRRAAWRIASDLLAHADIEKPPNVVAANEAASELLVTRELRRPLVETYLSVDEAGQRIQFVFDPTRLDGVPDHALVDRILSWDAFIGQSRMAPLVESMERRTERIVAGAQEWIHDHIDKLVAHEPNGVATARIFCTTVAQEISREEQAPSPDEKEALRQTHFLQAIFETPHPENGKDLQDIKVLQRDLQLALGERIERMAVWVRCALMTFLVTSFGLAAWGYIRTALAGSVEWPSAWALALLDPWIVPVGALALNLAIAWRRIVQDERRITESRDRLVRAIQEKYKAVIRYNILQQTGTVYSRILDALREEEDSLAKWSKATGEAREEILGNLKLNNAYQCLCLEAPLILGSLDKDRLEAQRATPGDQERIFERWARQSPSLAWREANKDRARDRAYDFAFDLVLADGHNRRSIEDLTEMREDSHNLREIVQSLQRHTHLQISTQGFPTAIKSNYLGIYDKGSTRVGKWVAEPDATQVVSTRDAMRVMHAPTAHGLELRSLKIWEGLREKGKGEKEKG